MQIQVNDKRVEVDEGITVGELIERLAIGAGPVAVERNGALVPRGEHGRVALCVGDVLEVVRFVGGG